MDSTDTSGPESFGNLLRQAFEQLRQGDAEAADTLCQHALTMHPGHPAALHMQGLAALATRQMPEAEALFKEAIAGDPNHAQCHLALGNLYRQTRRPREAVLSYQRAVSLNSGLFEAHYAMAHTLHHVGEVASALNSYQAARTLQPENVQLLVNMSAAHNRLNQFEQARECAGRAVEIDPHFAPAHGNLANSLSEMGQWDEAIKAYERSLALAPEQAMARANLGSCYLRQGRLVPAAEAYDEALQRRPNDVTALAMRAAIHNETGEHPQRDAIIDYPRLLKTLVLPTPEGFGTDEQFRQALAEYLLAHPSLRDDPDSQTTRGGQQSGALNGRDSPVMEALLKAIRQQVVQRFGELGDTSPLGNRPTHWRMDTWATVLAGQGHQIPHLHPTGWLSGVYYVQVPSAQDQPAPDAGAIEFGRAPEHYGFKQAPNTHLLQPTPGTLVLFPSYFFHRTIAHEDTTPRISVAFDIVRVLSPAPLPDRE